MQSIATENNLSETAFFVPRRPAGEGANAAGTRGEGIEYDLRWFTPVSEMDLCGHATLASAFVVFSALEPARTDVTFHSRSGPLTVRREGEELIMDFPAWPPTRRDAPPGLEGALGRVPREVWMTRDVMAVFDSEDDVRAIVPSFDGIGALGVFGVIVTAPGREADFVSRYFAPLQNIPEDPVTGSAHCSLIPYWAKRLGRTRLRALQLSARGGELMCEDRGERVTIAGRAVRYLEGTIEI